VTTNLVVKATVKSVERTVFSRLEHKPNLPVVQQILFFGVAINAGDVAQVLKIF
jgi:hypothetical protein